MKKLFRIISLILALSMIFSTLVSCKSNKKNTNEEPDDTKTEYYDTDSVYAQACSLGYKGTLEEFIALISGRNGKDGAGIKSSLIDNNGHLIFVLTDGTTIDAGALPGTDNRGRFKVTFDYGNGDGQTVYSKNYRVERPEDPIREGYEFMYWFIYSTQNDHSEPDRTIWLFDAYAVTADITLHACWKESDSTGSGNNSGNNNPPSSTTVRYEVPANGYDGSEVTITFYHTMGQNLRNVLDRYIKKFNELYPNITIEHSQIGGYDDVRDQINKQLTVGNQPNIAYCYPDHVALYNVTNKVIPLDNLIESTAPDGNGGTLGLTQTQINNFIDGFYAIGGVYDAAGTMYSLPMSMSTEVMYYNKTFFDEHDLQIPTTWDEMEAVCAQIKDILANDSDPNNDNNIPLAYDSEANWFITMTEQYGSPYTSIGEDKYLFNNRTNRNFVKMLRGWYEKKYVTTTELYGAYASQLFTNNDPTRPSCYMFIGSNGSAGHQIPIGEDGNSPFTVGVAAIPQVNPKNPKAISQGPSLCIFDQSGDRDGYDNDQEVLASWLFMKFLTTDAEFQAAFSMTSGYMPVMEKEVIVAQVPSYGEWLAEGNIVTTAIEVSLAQKDAYFVIPAFNGSTKARDQVSLLMQYCFTTPTTDVDAMILEAFKGAIRACLADT